MANIEDCHGFETFGADVKAARQTCKYKSSPNLRKIGVYLLPV